MNPNIPVLYSFRRCPYAMRARMAVKKAEINIELREVLLRNKPPQLLAISAKATVPVLQLPNGTIIDESLDIMHWALTQNDPDNCLQKEIAKDILQLIQWNDGEFKYYLDRYKYADRYPEHDEIFYRIKGEVFLIELEKRLTQNRFLCSNSFSLADMAIFPFIRQFTHVHLDWFQDSEYSNLKRWLFNQIESPLFVSIMEKYPSWQAGDEVVCF